MVAGWSRRHLSWMQSTSSTTSKKISFFLCMAASARHGMTDMAPAAILSLTLVERPCNGGSVAKCECEGGAGTQASDCWARTVMTAFMRAPTLGGLIMVINVLGSVMRG